MTNIEMLVGGLTILAFGFGLGMFAEAMVIMRLLGL